MKKSLLFALIIGALIILVGGFVWHKILTTSSDNQERSIAVLPFRNDSPDQDNQYFCDGMMDEILNHLQKIEDLGVKSRTAVEPYRGSNKSFNKIASELDVVYILEGAVRKFGENFRLTTQLIDVATGNHLWSETYDGILSDTIFVIQSNIAKMVASSLNTVITPDVDERIDRFPTNSIKAYDSYLKGRGEVSLFWKTRDINHLKTAREYFRFAIQLDPDFLQAVVQLGMAYSGEHKFDSALLYVNRVIELDPKSNHGYGMKGMIYNQMGKFDNSIENLLIAINLPPRDGLWYWYHVTLGRIYHFAKSDFAKALPYFNIGFSNSENHVSYYSIWAAIFVDCGDYENAEKFVRAYLELGDKDCWNSVKIYTDALVAQGKYQQAQQYINSICHKLDCNSMCQAELFRISLLIEEFELAENYYNSFDMAGAEDYIVHFMNVHIGYVYHQLGKTDEAERIFSKEIKALESELNKDWMIQEKYELLSKIYAFIGEKTEALDYLIKYDNMGFGRGFHDFIMIDPFFEGLREDPDFLAIVKQAQQEKADIRAQIRELETRGELDI